VPVGSADRSCRWQCAVRDRIEPAAFQNAGERRPDLGVNDNELTDNSGFFTVAIARQ
jgi:hypothetical protein